MSKRGQKIIPDQPVLPSDDQPSSSKRVKKENKHPEKSNKKRQSPKKK